MLALSLVYNELAAIYYIAFVTIGTITVKYMLSMYREPITVHVVNISKSLQCSYIHALHSHGIQLASFITKGNNPESANEGHTSCYSS